MKTTEYYFSVHLFILFFYYTLAKHALEKLKTLKTSQTILMLGETGSGKSETTKNLTRYITHSAKINSEIEEKISKTNIILEALGNAKTSANNNSSRFGKYIEVSISYYYYYVSYTYLS